MDTGKGPASGTAGQEAPAARTPEGTTSEQDPERTRTMIGRNVVRLAMATALFGAAIPGAAMAQYPNAGDQYPNAGGKYWNPEAQHNQQFHRGDFEGRWVVQNRYDADDRGGWGNGSSGGGWGNGGWGNGGWGNGGWGNGGWGRNGGF